MAIGLAALAAIVGFVQVRAHRDLWAGAVVLTALLVLESYIGGLIRRAAGASLKDAVGPQGIEPRTRWLKREPRRRHRPPTSNSAFTEPDCRS